jgi:hypothetical protein
MVWIVASRITRSAICMMLFYRRIRREVIARCIAAAGQNLREVWHARHQWTKSAARSCWPLGVNNQTAAVNIHIVDDGHLPVCSKSSACAG